MDPSLIVVGLGGPAITALVTWTIFQRTQSRTAQDRKERTTLGEAKLAISTWQDLTAEFQSQMRGVQTRLDACYASESELRSKLANLEIRLSSAGKSLSNGHDQQT